jgi:hypothetical protein
MQWRRFITVSLTLSVVSFSQPVVNAADPGIRASTEISTFPGNLENQHRVRAFEVSATFNNPELVTFSATFAGDISVNSFMPTGNATPAMRVKIFYSQPGSGADYSNITIETPKTPYQNETKIDAISTNSCGAKTWMNRGAGIVYFEIIRNCYDLPDKFHSALYIDSDLNKSGAVDFIYLPASSSLPSDFSKIPKPAKILPKKDQVIAEYPAQQSYTLDVNSAYFSTSTNSGLAIQIVGKSPTVCSVTSSTTISLTGVGTCVVAMNAPGSDLWNPSSEVTFSFSVLPKKVVPKVDQKLYFNPPGTLYENSGETKLDIYTDSQLDVQVVSSTPDVCIFPYSVPNNTVVKIYNPGTCAFTVKQAGNDRFNPREGSTSIQIYAIVKPAPSSGSTKVAPAPPVKKPKEAPKTITLGDASVSTKGGSSSSTNASGSKLTNTKQIEITCYKAGPTGIEFKKVKTVNPVCPKGYKQKK